jgi:alkylated DNA nucleotide flippase Atl1
MQNKSPYLVGELAAVDGKHQEVPWHRFIEVIGHSQQQFGLLCQVDEAILQGGSTMGAESVVGDEARQASYAGAIWVLGM